MAKTTKTTFQHNKTSDLIITYKENSVIAKNAGEAVCITNDEIKRINKVINKNLKLSDENLQKF